MNSWLRSRGANPPLPNARPAIRYRGIAENPKRFAKRARMASPMIAAPSSRNRREKSAVLPAIRLRFAVVAVEPAGIVEHLFQTLPRVADLPAVHQRDMRGEF